MTARELAATPVRRPAETAAPAALAVAYLVAQLLGIENEQTVWAIAVVVSFVPAAVTWVVSLRRGSA